MTEIYRLMIKSATDVGILRLTAEGEWDSLQRLVDGLLYRTQGCDRFCRDNPLWLSCGDITRFITVVVLCVRDGTGAVPYH